MFLIRLFLFKILFFSKDSTKTTKKKLMIATKIQKKGTADKKVERKNLIKKPTAKIQKANVKKIVPSALDKEDQKLFLV